MKLVKGKQADSFRAINFNHTNTSLILLFDYKSIFKNRSSGIIALMFGDCQGAFVIKTMYNRAMKPFLRHWCRTKIVCTIGPATGSETMVRRLIRAGMDVARLNMSHGTPEEHAAHIKLIRDTAREMGTTVAILLDLPGPKHRVGKLQGGKVRLNQGAAVTLTDQPAEGNPGLIPVTLPGLASGLVPGRTILLDDGALQIKVTAVNGREVQGRVTAGGLLVQGRGVVVPGMPNPGPFVSEELQQLLLFAARQQPDYIALSFVSHARDVRDARKILREAGADIPIVSKIERSDALKVFDAILATSDAVMVARGDLGVEIPLERVPLAQKRIIRKCKPWSRHSGRCGRR